MNVLIAALGMVDPARSTVALPIMDGRMSIYRNLRPSRSMGSRDEEGTANRGGESFGKEECVPMKKQILNKRERMSRNDMIASGLKQHCPKGVIYSDGASVKAAEAIKLFEEASAAEKKATASRAQYLADVAAARAAETKVKVLVTPIKNYVTGLFGKKSAIVAEFGFGPEANKPTAEIRFEAVEKLRATRTARGTKGSRQKAAIHGELDSSSPEPAPQASPQNGATNGMTNGAAASAVLSLNGSSH